jgi:hypothetical protein
VQGQQGSEQHGRQHLWHQHPVLPSSVIRTNPLQNKRVSIGKTPSAIEPAARRGAGSKPAQIEYRRRQDSIGSAEISGPIVSLKYARFPPIGRQDSMANDHARPGTGLDAQGEAIE